MTIYSIINPAINYLLRSPWHRRLSKRIMTVSYLGRRTGKHFEVPVSYYRNGSAVYCFTNGQWRHNFNAETAATLRIAGTAYPARGKVFDGEHGEQIDLMSAYFKAVPQDKKFYGIRCGIDGELVRSQVEQALASITIIEFTLDRA